MWYGEVVFSELGNISEEELGEEIASGYRPKFQESTCFATIWPRYVSLIKNCWYTLQQIRPTADKCVAEVDDILTGRTA